MKTCLNLIKIFRLWKILLIFLVYFLGCVFVNCLVGSRVERTEVIDNTVTPVWDEFFEVC